MRFQQPIALTATSLTKLSPGVGQPGVHLGVWPQENGFSLWGVTRQLPALCLVVDIAQPGFLVVKHQRVEGTGKFANVAVLQGEQVKLVETHNYYLEDDPPQLQSLLGLAPGRASQSVNVLLQLAVAMRGHGRGGSLLVVPSGSEQWRESMVHPISYPVASAFRGLPTYLSRQVMDKNQHPWQGTLHQQVEMLAGLTTIDGATMMSDEYELLAFGAKIRRRQGKPWVKQLLVREPVRGNKAVCVHPSKYAGTRHLSAAQFVHDQPDALALIASQDGRFTIFGWSPAQQIVQAHRIDSLLV